MENNNSSSVPIKAIWQITLVLALILGVWVLGRVLPIGEYFPALAKNVKSASSEADGGLGVIAPKIDAYALPRISEQTPSALKAIATEISLAQKEVLVSSESITSALLWAALRDKTREGVDVQALLSRENTKNFAQGKLAAWLRQNQLTSIYQDAMKCASNMIIVDQSTVIISDLPFSQKEFDAIGKTPQQLKESTMGVAYIIHSPSLAEDLARMLRLRLTPANKLL